MWYVVYSISYACRSCTKCSLRENILSILYVTIKWRKKRNLSTTRETIFETKTSTIMKELYNKETLIFNESGFSYTNIVGRCLFSFARPVWWVLYEINWILNCRQIVGNPASLFDLLCVWISKVTHPNPNFERRFVVHACVHFLSRVHFLLYDGAFRFLFVLTCWSLIFPMLIYIYRVINDPNNVRSSAVVCMKLSLLNSREFSTWLLLTKGEDYQVEQIGNEAGKP